MLNRVSQVIEKYKQPPSRWRHELAPYLHYSKIRVAFLHDPHFLVNGEEGAHSLGDMGRYHLPLRGKLDG
jgi:hypothetical protein